MKPLKLKAILTALTFFGVTAIFAQVDSSKSTSPQPSATDQQVGPEASPMVTDSASSSSVVPDSSAVMDHSNMTEMNHNSLGTDSSSAEYKAEKKRMKAAKKESTVEKMPNQ